MSESPGCGKLSCLWRGAILAIVFEEYKQAMTKEISVFVDESGSFAPAGSDLHSPYYLLCMVFHDQTDDISNEIARLRDAFIQTGLAADHTVHAGPIIRREDEYRTMSRELRIRIFRRMMVFIQKTNFKYKCFKLFKPYNSGDGAIHDTLLQDIVDFLISHRDDFNTSEKIKVYYDNGQTQVTALLKEAFAIYSSKVEFAADVHPSKYRLFQVADVICTLELVKAKLTANGSISESEERFFGGIKNLKKNYLKPLHRKEYR